MNKLDCLVIAEPSESTASLVADQMERMAKKLVLAHRGRDVLAQVKENQPDMLLLSLELFEPEPEAILSSIRRAGLDPFVVATYRELSVRGMKNLGKYGIGEFISHPLDATAVYRAASRHFGRPFRRHERHQVSLPVVRIDGATIGTTCDLSEGGMLVSLKREVTTGMSQLWEIGLDDGEAKPLRVRCVVLGVDQSEGTTTAARVQFEKVVGPELNRLSTFLMSRQR